MKPITDSLKQAAQSAAQAIRNYYSAKYESIPQSPVGAGFGDSPMELIYNLFQDVNDDGFYEFHKLSLALVMFFKQNSNMVAFDDYYKPIGSKNSTLRMLERLSYFFEDLRDDSGFMNLFKLVECENYWSDNSIEYYENLKNDYEIKLEVLHFERKLKTERRVA